MESELARRPAEKKQRQRLLHRLLWAPLEKPWAALLTRYCRFVARHPLPFIIAPILLTAVLSTGILLNFKVVRGVHFLYAPLDAAWKTEEEVFHRNWAATDEQFYPGKDVLRRKGLYLIVQAKDGASILRKAHANDFLGLLEWLATVRLRTPEGEQYSYSDICLHFQNDCFSNSHAKLIASVFAKGNEHEMNITYPLWRSKFTTEPIDLSKTLGNVTLDSNGHVSGATTWLILYQLKQYEPRMKRLSTHFEASIEQFVRRDATPTSLLSIFHFHSESFENELAESNRRIIPRFAVTFVILIIFSVLCTFNMAWTHVNGRRHLVVDWVISKPLMGIAGVYIVNIFYVTTMMAIVSGMGLLLLFDVTFVDMCTVMPFLSLTIGIDDTFLMLAAWHETPRGAPVEERIGRSMRHAAVSISITSLTDSLAFLIGAIAPLPAVKYFCFYSAAAIAFIFTYSLTIFIALLSMQGRLERRACHSVTGRHTKDIANAEKATGLEMLLNLGSRPELSAPVSAPSSFYSKAPACNSRTELFYPYVANGTRTPSTSTSSVSGDQRLWYQRFFEECYAPFICRSSMQLFALLLFVCYAAGAVTGIQRLVVGFDLVNIIQTDSPAHEFLQIRNAIFPENQAHMDVAVLSPPNMGTKLEREKFMYALDDFESSSCSEGRNSTDFWYFAYHEYLNRLGFGGEWEEMNEDPEDFASNLNSFLLTSDRYSHDVLRYANGSIRAFRFSTSLKNFGTDYHIVLCSEIMRGLAEKYAEYNITTYTPLWNLADQFGIMWPQTMQDLYISVAVMVPIALLFIPQPLCALMIGLNITSIAFGVIGFMAWWDVNLDATSMITIAMSVGFSVDFAAHVTYAYMTEAAAHALHSANHKMSPRDRLVATLGTVGWPVTQASASVILGISTLATVDSYVVQTCFKTVLLVVLCGAVHALIFLPLVLMRCHEVLVSLQRLGAAVFSTSGPKKESSASTETA